MPRIDLTASALRALIVEARDSHGVVYITARPDLPKFNTVEGFLAVLDEAIAVNGADTPFPSSEEGRLYGCDGNRVVVGHIDYATGKIRRGAG